MNDNITSPKEYQLADHHRHLLEAEMGIISDTITARGYQTISAIKDLAELGFSSACRLPGLLVPLHSPDGISETFVYRPDDPKVIKKPNTKGNTNGMGELNVKFLTPKGDTVQLDCHPASRDMLRDSKITLYITDDPIKADILASHGLCVIAVTGIWGFRGKANPELVIQLPAWDHIALTNRQVRFLNDTDSKNDPQIQKVFLRLGIHLKRKKANVEWASFPSSFEIQNDDPAELTSDNASQNDFEKSIKTLKSPQTPKSPTYKIVPNEGKEIKRPLCLLGGKAYAATWQKVEKITTEEVDDKGNIIQFDSPQKTTETKLIVLSSDGTVFGMETPIGSSGIDIHLRESISPENRWSDEGVNRFLNKDYPDPKAVFEEIIRVIDHFIDFHKSISDQRTMCEFIACWVIATWFLDAFNVTGYLWVTGERGSGKTNLLILISQLSYLGLFVSQSGSFASLRDMADYGATLACDDAENITDPKKTDPDKMALLLAGNRKGLTIPIKEQGPDKAWQIRYVNAYCPRAFSAIRIPDPTMASRTIILPLLRTPNKSKGNIDPMEFENWPSDRRQLIDDLWGLALYKLPLLPNWDKWVGQKAKLIGRNLQPWRSVLAVSIWLEKCGVESLYERMESLSLDYQKERPELEIADSTRIVIQAVCNCAISAINANSANNNVRQVNVKVSDVSDAVNKILDEEDIDFDPKYLGAKRIGRILSKLRFPEAPRQGGKGSRIRVINLQDLADLAESYKVEFQYQHLLVEPEIPFTALLPINGTNGTNGTNGIDQRNFVPLEVDCKAEKVPVQHCYACGRSEFWQRSDGGWVCGTCHPNPNSY